MKVRGKNYRAVWMEKGAVVVINQLRLPHQFSLLRLKNHHETARAIKTMIIRGAGTIGATAAYGMAQARLEGVDLDCAYHALLETRPTAADLKHALDRVRARASSAKEAVAEAEAIADEYVDRAKRIAEVGLPIVKNGSRILTHCNAG
jgi:methylthioribose-1-phosphate isomerase